MEAGRAWGELSKTLKREIYVLRLCYRDPRVPWYAKALAALVIAYAFSPIDLIPDFIPVVGYLDDMVVVPIGIALVLRMIPKEVHDEYAARAEKALAERPRSFWMPVVIVVVWVVLLAVIAAWAAPWAWRVIKEWV